MLSSGKLARPFMRLFEVFFLLKKGECVCVCGGGISGSWSNIVELCCPMIIYIVLTSKSWVKGEICDVVHGCLHWLFLHYSLLNKWKNLRVSNFLKTSGQKVINIYGWSTYFDWNGIGELSKVVWLYPLSYAGINIGSSSWIVLSKQTKSVSL